MAIRIRLAMRGPRHNRVFHLVAVQQQTRRNGKPIETLGIYNPRVPPGETTKNIQWSVDRIRHWLSVGALPSRAAERLLALGNITVDSAARPPVSKTESSEAPAQA